MVHLQVLCAFKIHITDGFFSCKIRPLSEITDSTTRYMYEGMAHLWIKARGLGQGWTRPAARAPGRPSPRAAGPRAGSTYYFLNEIQEMHHFVLHHPERRTVIRLMHHIMANRDIILHNAWECLMMNQPTCMCTWTLLYCPWYCSLLIPKTSVQDLWNRPLQPIHHSQQSYCLWHKCNKIAVLSQSMTLQCRVKSWQWRLP